MEGKVAVGYSIMNRMASPSWGNTVMSIIFQRLQYSSLTHYADPQLALWPADSDLSWQMCLEVADSVLTKQADNPIEAADSYHDTSIRPPSWATSSTFIKQIGRLMFHKVGK
jgi:spore germination cell wall hydrolase CwlJ-like protein